MDKVVTDELFEHLTETAQVGELKFLLDEGLDLLANYAKVSDGGIRRALLGLVEAIAKAER